MQYTSRKANVGVFLIIPGMMVLIAGRLLSLLEASSPPGSLVAIIAEFMLIGGGIAAIFGAILLGIGIPETKRIRTILEIVLVRKEVTLSEISAQTGFNIEYIRKTISDLIATGFLNGFLEVDRFVSEMAKDSTS